MTAWDRIMDFFKRRPDRSDLVMARLDQLSDEIAKKSDVVDAALSRYSEANDPLSMFITDLYLRKQMANIVGPQKAAIGEQYPHV